MARRLVITADSHAGPPPGQYRDYLDPAYRDAYEEFSAQRADQKREMERQFGGDLFAEGVEFGGRNGAWDHDVRMRELEELGIVADVVFPDGQNENPVPFSLNDGVFAPDQEMAGAKAHNRWLAEFCALAPERHAGVALVPLHDIDWAVEETKWARDAGLRGGIFVSPWVGDLPYLHHPRYEPVWAACADLGMPLNFHSSPQHPDYGDHPGSVAIFATEVAWFSHRPLWFLLWGGVFERHPELKMALVEQSSSWVPYTLAYLDGLYERPYFAHFGVDLSMRPSEYWARQCFVSGFIDTSEFAVRDKIGVPNLLWGSDYPHAEGIHDPHKNLPKVMGGASDHDVDRVLGDNAAQLYGFEVDTLRPLADRIGPDF
jgi:predicted TIM-barrel fold metal-dependent hydrolase